MTKHTKAIIILLTSVVLISTGQLLLKKGLLDLGSLNFSSELFATFSLIFSNGYVLLGITCYILSSISWLLVLSKSQLSFAYPLLSIGYIIVSLLSVVFFAEHLPMLRLLGLGCILTGGFLMSRS